MRAFLLDTMIWGYLYDKDRYPKEYSNIRNHIESLPSYIRHSISVVSLGEIAVGYPGSIQTQHLLFIRSLNPSILKIDYHIAEVYGKLRGDISKKVLKRKKGLNPKDFVDRFTWLEAGSLENDLWIAAQAISRNLTLVTNDSMKRIEDIAKESLHIENWASNSK